MLVYPRFYPSAYESNRIASDVPKNGIAYKRCNGSWISDKTVALETLRAPMSTITHLYTLPIKPKGSLVFDNYNSLIYIPEAQRLVALSMQSLAISDDHGVLWTVTSPASMINSYWKGLYYLPAPTTGIKRLYAICFKNIAISEDMGETWLPTKIPMYSIDDMTYNVTMTIAPKLDANGVIPNTSVIYAVASNIIKYTEDGITWISNSWPTSSSTQTSLCYNPNMKTFYTMVYLNTAQSKSNSTAPSWGSYHYDYPAVSSTGIARYHKYLYIEDRAHMTFARDGYYYIGNGPFDTWTKYPIGRSYLNDKCYNHIYIPELSMYVVTGTSKFAYSLDGRGWITVPVPQDNGVAEPFVDIVYDSDKRRLCFIGANTGRVYVTGSVP